MNAKQVDAMADAVVKTITAAITGPKVDGRFVALEQRIAALEARPTMKWAGVHVTGVPYAEASIVTKAGSLWAAERQTDTTPGDPGSDWRLIVKRGQAR